MDEFDLDIDNFDVPILEKKPITTQPKELWMMYSELSEIHYNRICKTIREMRKTLKKMKNY